MNGKNRCDKCSKNKSSLECKVEYFLKKNNIEYEYQYKNEQCKFKREIPIDFALLRNSKVYAFIEADGRQHFNEIKMFGGKKRFEHQKEIDRIKDNFAKVNNIPMLRIPYWEFRDDTYKNTIRNFIKNII